MYINVWLNSPVLKKLLLSDYDVFDDLGVNHNESILSLRDLLVKKLNSCKSNDDVFLLLHKIFLLVDELDLLSIDDEVKNERSK